MGWFSDIFGGGDTTAVTTTTSSTTNVRVDPVTNVAIDTKSIADAIRGLVEVNKDIASLTTDGQVKAAQANAAALVALTVKQAADTKGMLDVFGQEMTAVREAGKQSVGTQLLIASVPVVIAWYLAKNHKSWSFK